MFVRVNLETKGGCAAIILALECIFGMAADHLFGQFRRIIFCHTFQHGLQDDTLRAISNVFLCRHHPHAILFQSCLVMGAVIAVAGKAVQLPDHNHVKQPFGAVLNHPLEIRAVICLGRKGAVDILLDYHHSILFAVFHALPELAFNGLFPLVVGGVAGIDYSIHPVTSSSSSAFSANICKTDSFMRL